MHKAAAGVVEGNAHQHFVILGGVKARVKQANFDKGVTADQFQVGGVHGTQVFLEIVLARQLDKVNAVDFVTVFVNVDAAGVSIDGVSLPVLHADCDCIGVQVIVAVKKGDNLSAGSNQRLVLCMADTTVIRQVNQFQARVALVAVEYFPNLRVRRGIIDCNDFKVFPALLQGAVKTLAQIAGVVVNRNHNGNQGFITHGAQKTRVWPVLVIGRYAAIKQKVADAAFNDWRYAVAYGCK